MTDSEPVPPVIEDKASIDKAEQIETSEVTTDEPTQQEVTAVPIENAANETEADQNKPEEKELIPESSTEAIVHEPEYQSKEPSSERQFQDAEKATEGEEEVYDENDSEYEDVDDDEDEGEKEAVDKSQASASNNVKTEEEDDERINLKPRRLPKTRGEDENSEGYEDDDNQNAEQSQKASNRRSEKKSDKNAEPLDDDNDSRNPAYVPRRGKFYEHDDRTNDELEQPKQEVSRNRSRPYKDSDARWQHDLYFDDYEEDPNSRPHNYRGQARGRFRRGGGGNSGGDRNQLHLNDYISPRQRGRRGGYQSQPYYNEGNDYRQRVAPSYNKPQNDQGNNFDVEEYNRPPSYNNRGRGNRGKYVEQHAPPRRQRREFDQYQTDEQLASSRRNQQQSQLQQQQQSTAEQAFHRERNFTNSQFQHQQQRSAPKSTNNTAFSNRDEQKRPTGPPIDVYQNENRDKNRNQRRENNEPPRRQARNNRNSQQNEGSAPNSNLSAEAPSFERPKRYSNMRSNLPNTGQLPQQQQQQQQQAPPQNQQHQMPMQPYQDQRTNYYEQSHWQQPPPANQYIPPQQQIMPTQMYHAQQPIPTQSYYVHQQYPQPAQYVPMNYTQGSMTQQMQDK